MNFMDFARQNLMAQGGPTPEAAPTPVTGGTPTPANPTYRQMQPVRKFERVNGPGGNPESLMLLLALLQAGAYAGRDGRSNMPSLGGGSPGRPFDSTIQPDAGDLYDYNYSNGDPGLLNLFGSAPPERRVDGPMPFRPDQRR